MQVAFGPGAQSLPSLRTFPVNKDGKTADGSIVKHDQLEAGSSDAYSVKLKKDYKEPWVRNISLHISFYLLPLWGINFSCLYWFCRIMIILSIQLPSLGGRLTQVTQVWCS